MQQVFLRGGQTDLPVDYQVQMLFEGRTFATARVEAHQDGAVISHATVGLTIGVDGPDRQDDPPERPPLASTVNRDEIRDRPNWQNQPVLTFIEPNGHDTGEPDLAFWLRPAGPMPNDPLMHQAVLAYVTDRGLMSVAWQPHSHEGGFKGATLDHTIWFHRPIVFNDWHSHVMHSPTLTDGRGLNHGVVHDQAGVLVASTAQQGMMRPA